LKELRISNEAERDLDDIWQFLFDESKSSSVANRFIDQLTTRLTILEHSPKAGRRSDAMGSKLRALPIGNYLVYYREDERFVTVARVIHGKREQSAAFSEDSE
jgi:plasmid stabilization system protein ParE